MVETTDEGAPPAPFNSMEFDAGSEETRAAAAAAGAMLLETIDDDDAAPTPFNSTEFDSDNEEKRTATAAAGAMLLETIDDDDAAPTPFNSTEFDSDNEEKRTATAAAAAGAMLLEATDDDDSAPAPFNLTEFDYDNEGKTMATAAAGGMLLGTIDDDPAPAPFNSMEFEEQGADSSKPNAMQRTNISYDDSTLIPVHRDIRDQSAQFRTGLASNRVPLFPAGRAGMDRNDGRNRGIDIHSRPRNAVESRAHPMDNNLPVVGEEKEEVSGPDIFLEADVERDFTIHIPEATLVVERDEEEVYIATPVDPATPPEPSVPWWKHRRTKFGEIIIVLAALSIAISQLMDKKDEPVAPVVAPVPSISMAPSSSLVLFTTTSPTSPALPSATCMMDMMNPECGATLDTWTDIGGGESIASLMSGTDNLAMTPDTRARLTSLLEAPSNFGDNYGSRMWGWLVPPVTGDYTFWIATGDAGELWLSIDDDPENKVRACYAPHATWYERNWDRYPEQQSTLIPLVAGQAYYFEALMKEWIYEDWFAIAWEYPGQTLEVVPVTYSRTSRPGWPVTCSVDSDCDDGIFCNGDETCSTDGVCMFGTLKPCSDGLLCTEDVCIESTKSCENPATDCSGSDDPCATDQCMESLGGCHFSCGATLDTWEFITDGIFFSDLSVTNTLTKTPDKTERLGSLLEAPPIGDDYGRRMWGWLVPPVTADYTFWIAANELGELWLSIDDDPANRVRVCYAPTAVEERDWYSYPEQRSTLIPLVAGQAYYFEALMKEVSGNDHLAIAWEYPDQTLEVVPVTYSRTSRPGWPVTCLVDSDCDDGIFCNGDETCSTDGVCMFCINQPCSDGLLCTEDVCIETTKSCENPITDCLASNYSCASDQCIESLGGCQFSCGATLDTWTDISGESIADLMSGTDNLLKAPNKSERLGSFLEAESFTGDNYGSRMWGWLVPPVTGDYTFWIASDDAGELWLSIDDDPANKVRACYNTYATWYERNWDRYSEQRSTLIPLVAGQAYYFEVCVTRLNSVDSCTPDIICPNEGMDIWGLRGHCLGVSWPDIGGDPCHSFTNDKAILSSKQKPFIIVGAIKSTSTSLSPSSSMAPSALLFPSLHSQCFIEVTIVYDSYPKETHYELVEIIDITSEENEFLISRNASVGDTSQTESFCLVEGDYEFTVSDIYGVCMLCMYGRVSKYNITRANDEIDFRRTR